jgi:hypothetical protein
MYVIKARIEEVREAEIILQVGVSVKHMYEIPQSVSNLRVDKSPSDYFPQHGVCYTSVKRKGNKTPELTLSGANNSRLITNPHPKSKKTI